MGRQLPCFAFYGLQDIATMPESDGEIHFLEIDCLNGSIFRERQVKIQIRDTDFLWYRPAS